MLFNSLHWQKAKLPIEETLSGKETSDKFDKYPKAYADTLVTPSSIIKVVNFSALKYHGV